MVELTHNVLQRLITVLSTGAGTPSYRYTSVTSISTG